MKYQGWKPQWRAWRAEHDAKVTADAHVGDQKTVGEVSIKPCDGVQVTDMTSNEKDQEEHTKEKENDTIEN